ncbi:MAG: Na/Pi cotransporter family protein, partial [Clostridia bacterium]|nr:Na/Pi cotransporter family protein [Clostridia bacterium]
ITAVLSSVGANKNAKRAAMVHLSFNVIGTCVGLAIFCIVKAILAPVILSKAVSQFEIAVSHSIFNILCTVLMLPLAGFLEKLVCHLVPDSKGEETETELDVRLLNTPAIALERCRVIANEMANCAVGAFKDSLKLLSEYSPELAQDIRKAEKRTDHYEDILGTYLVKLSMRSISDADSNEAAKLLKIIGDFERISDHAVNVIVSVEEMKEKDLTFSKAAEKEMGVLVSAVNEILNLSLSSFLDNDTSSAELVEPLEQIIDELKESLRTNHILRMQQGGCGIEVGFVWSDLLTNLERVSDHCSNIAGCVTDISLGNLNLHESVKDIKNDKEKYREHLEQYSKVYSLENV